METHETTGNVWGYGRVCKYCRIIDERSRDIFVVGNLAQFSGSGSTS